MLVEDADCLGIIGLCWGSCIHWYQVLLVRTTRIHRNIMKFFFQVSYMAWSSKRDLTIVCWLSERRYCRIYDKEKPRTLITVSAAFTSISRFGVFIYWVLVSIATYFKSVLSKTNFDVGSKLAYFLATGNLVSPTGLDLQQTSGFTIVAEKLNFYRYLSHFRCIHRGAFFAELKTTTVRKLLPESWGMFRFYDMM